MAQINNLKLFSDTFFLPIFWLWLGQAISMGGGVTEVGLLVEYKEGGELLVLYKLMT